MYALQYCRKLNGDDQERIGRFVSKIDKTGSLVFKYNTYEYIYKI